MAGTSKQSKGKQKIEIKKIENKNDLMITFSKRRSGIIKKTNEIMTMCGAAVGLVIFSPSGKPSSFGHPSLETVTNRFLNKNIAPGVKANDVLQPIIDAYEKMRVDSQNEYLNELRNRLDEAKELEKELQKITRAQTEGVPADREVDWWEKSVDDLSPGEIMQEISYMKAFHGEICNNLNHPVDLVGLGLVEPVEEQIAVTNPINNAEARGVPLGRMYKS